MADTGPATDSSDYDVIIVGGGPAGLNAALILGRCRRRVLLCDSGKPRNAASRGVHGFLSRDGELPFELRRIAREQMARYPTVVLRDAEICEARRIDGGFEVATAEGRRFRSRKLLLATGVLDELPDIPGFQAFYGRGVYTCPYCDGWENRDRPIAVYGPGERCVGLALEMTIWSRDIILITNGPARLSPEDRKRLARRRIPIIETPVAALEGGDDGLEQVRFVDGTALPCAGLFLNLGEREGSRLIEMAGSELSDKATVETRSYERTEIPGLYVAGDASRRVQFAIVAAAEGAMAAFAINTELLKEDLAKEDRAAEEPPHGRSRETP